MFENGRLTPQDKMAVNAWFNVKQVQKDCPACGHMSYAIDDQLYQWTPVAASGQPKRAIIVECHDCGHIRYFDPEPILALEEAG